MESGGGSSGDPWLKVPLFGRRRGSRLSPGIWTNIRVAYRNLPSCGRVDLHLSASLGPIRSAVPEATTSSDGRVVRDDLKRATGTLTIKVTVHPGAVTGQVVETVATIFNDTTQAAIATCSAVIC